MSASLATPMATAAGVPGGNAPDGQMMQTVQGRAARFRGRAAAKGGAAIKATTRNSGKQLGTNGLRVLRMVDWDVPVRSAELLSGAEDGVALVQQAEAAGTVVARVATTEHRVGIVLLKPIKGRDDGQCFTSPLLHGKRLSTSQVYVYTLGGEMALQPKLPVKRVEVVLSTVEVVELPERFIGNTLWEQLKWLASEFYGPR